MQNKKLSRANSRWAHWASACLLLSSSLVHALDFEAEGVAAIGMEGLEAARRTAVQDAIRQASLLAGGSVVSIESLQQTDSQEALQAIPERQVRGYQLLREWQENGLLRVRIQADVADEPTRTFNKCVTTKNKPNYRYKVAVTPFHVLKPIQVQDLGDPWSELARELTRKLESSDGFLPTLTARMPAFDPVTGNFDTFTNRDVIRQIALETNAQFVIVSQLIDAGVGKNGAKPYVGWAGDEGGRRIEAVFPDGGFAAGVRAEARTRRFETELFLFDGLSGALIARHRLSGVAQGDVKPSREQPLGGAAFATTDLGRTVEKVLRDMVTRVQDETRCLPFTANIVRLENNQAVIDAGTTTRLQPGDRLAIYRKQGAWITTLDTPQFLGIAEQAAGTLVIERVQPQFASGRVIGDSSRLRTGDLVRFESSTSRR